MNEIKLFSPATVANVSCGFDALGFALDALGDEMIFRKTKEQGIKIIKIEGASLSFDIDKNVVGVVTQALFRECKPAFGVEIEINKKFKPGSGLGSSAASAAGTAYAINAMLGNPFSLLELTKFAMLGEEAACGAQIADNVSAAIYGGFILVRSYDPLEIIKLPCPSELVASVIHPQIEIKTEDARNILPKEIALNKGIIQWANVGGLVSGLYTNNYSLIGNSLEDVIIEPIRKSLIPHFDLVKKAAMKAGALGVGISGSGPSIFALSKGEIIAKKVALGMGVVYSKTPIQYEITVSKINTEGIKVLEIK